MNEEPSNKERDIEVAREVETTLAPSMLDYSNKSVTYMY